ncbi:MAG: L-ribulokinase [Verrucomicrobiota bacterium]|jgi:L-ribulokinase|nr:L-ribulokinase [Verrucomicrobiota bacterium]MDK2963385.1 L-ribulokinase [Verrucomicrobiota bacterium]
MIKKDEYFVVGADFGSDSVRVVILDAADGHIAGSQVAYYPRWKQGLYCNPKENQFRQHPLDYTESLVDAVTGAVREAERVRSAAGQDSIVDKICAMSIDTTGSTPSLADRNGTPLALLPEFSEDPDAMFILWKDHTAVREADEINETAHSWGGTDFTKFMGGTYSSEWFWSKLLHTIRKNPKVAKRAYTALEHCDWMTAVMTGTTDPTVIKRSRCAAGHKVMWHAEWGGYPPREFWDRLDPKLSDIRDTLGKDTWTTDVSAGTLTPEWAEMLGLPESVIVCVGAYDAHIGAVGGDIAPGTMVKSIGTSTCDILIGPKPDKGQKENLVKGICGQVDGSVVAGWIGYEAGQSAYGDYFAWFRNLLMWPVENLIASDPEVKNLDVEKIEKNLLRRLEEAAEDIEPAESSVVALDWINGRRTPFANQNLTAAISGLTLGTDSPAFLRALLEATAFGARSIIDTFEAGGLEIEKIIAIGGVARKSRLGMQILADITHREIYVTAGDQSCAIGAAVFAATAAGLYPDIFTAQKALSAGTDRVHRPDPARMAVYDRLYEKFRRLGNFIEDETKGAVK